MIDAMRFGGVRRWGNTVAVAAALLLVVIVAARSRHAPVASMSGPALAVPRIAQEPVLDGELDEAVWQSLASRSGPFVDAKGVAARPYSEARIAWSGDHLLLALYAADEDIRTGSDAIRITLGSTTFEASATGDLRGAPAGTRIGHEHDGTLDDPSDDDEEWGLELAIPLGALGLHGQPGERIVLTAERCDTPRGAARACSALRPVTLVLNGLH